MRIAAERVRAVGHVVTFEGGRPIRVERIVGSSLVTGCERTRKIWESGRPPGTRAADAIKAANAVREGAPPRPALTRSQRTNLAMLLAAGAVSRETAVSIFDHPAVYCIAPHAVGNLRDKGLALSRVASRPHRGSRRLTVYWLTEAGLAEARRQAAEVGA